MDKYKKCERICKKKTKILGITQVVNQFPVIYSNLQDEETEESLKMYYGRALRLLTQQLAKSLTGKFVVGINGQTRSSPSDRHNDLHQFEIIGIIDDFPGGIRMKEDGEELWDLDDNGEENLWVYWADYDDGPDAEACMGSGQDRIYVFVE